MKFQIITPERVVYADEIDQISMMTENGEVTILPHHIPLVTNLIPGELHYRKNSEDFVVAVAGGFGVVREDNSVLVLADAAERPDEINIAKAEEAKERAVKLMSEAKSREDVEFAMLQSKIEKELNRIRIGNKYRKI